MPVISRTIEIRFEHQIHFTDHVFAQENPLLKTVLLPAQGHSIPGAASKTRPAKALVVVDGSVAQTQSDLIRSIENYFQAQSDTLSLVSSPLLIEGGEHSKNSLMHVHEIHAQIERCHIDRQSYVIAVGGGALLDVAGFAAATAHRGVRHIRIPTTVLAQSDSGIGVKNGVNAFGKKNFIGTFAPPFAVINDFQLLSSLPKRQWRTGYIEAVKVALIRDRAFFEELEQSAGLLADCDACATRRLIRRCAELHFDHITAGGDPFELGSARPLDFGHWAAHKLEQMSGYRITHAEAVAIGIAIDTLYSHRIGWLKASAVERILRLIQKLGFDLRPPELSIRNKSGKLEILQGLEEFQEHLGGDLTITLLRTPGTGTETSQIDLELMRSCIEVLAQKEPPRLFKEMGEEV